MADGKFFLVRDLSEGTVEGRIVKQRIVTKPGVAVKLVRDLTFDGAAINATHGRAFDQCDYAYEPRGAVLHTAQSFEQQVIVGFIRSGRTAVARGVNARDPAEGVHLQPR